MSSDFQAGVYVDNLQGDFNKSSEHVSIKWNEKDLWDVIASGNLIISLIED